MKNILFTFLFLSIFTISAEEKTKPSQKVEVEKTKASEVLAPLQLDFESEGWRKLFATDSLEDWVHNCKEDTWKLEKGILYCKGNCGGGLMSKKSYKNFEISFNWIHHRYAGNAGFFVWVPKLPKKGLPTGIEIQILDLGYEVKHTKNGKKPWFTSHGDVFSCTPATFEPFEPVAKGRERSLPRKRLSKGHGQWNHYYIRCINGEVRLWVNGYEVSGGRNANPAEGPIAFEAEGAPVDFKDMWIRELP